MRTDELYDIIKMFNNCFTVYKYSWV